MSKALSVDLRERVVAAIAAGRTRTGLAVGLADLAVAGQDTRSYCFSLARRWQSWRSVVNQRVQRAYAAVCCAHSCLAAQQHSRHSCPSKTALLEQY